MTWPTLIAGDAVGRAEPRAAHRRVTEPERNEMIKSVAIGSGSTGEVPADQELPSYQVLAALVVSPRRELARAQERIAELEDRLRSTSRNSSRPPSGDGLAKPPPWPRSLRKKSGRRPGGQDGHPGATLVQVTKPDREQRHEPA